MQQDHFIPGKDASLEHSISLMQAGLAPPGDGLAGCDLHRRLLAEYAKAHQEAVTA